MIDKLGARLCRLFTDHRTVPLWLAPEKVFQRTATELLRNERMVSTGVNGWEVF